MGYFPRAVTLAEGADDGYGIANAAWHAGMVLRRSGHPDDALKCFQVGQLQLDGPWPGKPTWATPRTDDPRAPVLAASLIASSAGTHAVMDDPAQARNHLVRARDGWAPRDAFERATMDSTTAELERELGRVDTAAQFAQPAVRTFGETHCRGLTLANITLATVYVQAGEPRGMALAATGAG